MKARYLAAVLLGLFAVLTLLDRFVLVELLLRRITIPFLLAAALALAMIGAGSVARRARRVDVPLDLLLGYPLFGTVCFLVATLKISTWTMVPLLAICALAGVAMLLKRYAGDERPGATPLPPQPPLPPLHWSAFVVATVLTCGLVAAQAPPTSLDELAYHLAVPHTWVLEGRAVELPLLSHSYFPLGIESADIVPLLLLGPSDGGVASHLLHLFAALAVTLLVARRTSSWLATAAIVSTPALAITAGWSLVDWPLAGLFVALWMALEDDDANIAAIATAAGLLVKYTFAPFALIAYAMKRRVPRWPALLGLVFFVRNLVLTGNPFAPFLSADAPHVSGYRALALADYVFQGSYADEALGAAIVILPVFAAGLLAIGSAAAAVALFFLAPSSRILVPFLVVPSASAAPELRRRVLRVLVALAVIVQTFLVVWFTARSDAFSLLAGTASEQEYLQKQRPSTSAIAWLNATLPHDSRTLVVAHNELFWFTHPVRGGGNFDSPRISRYLDVPAPEALRARLHADGITHVAFIRSTIPTRVAGKREERETVLSEPAQRMLAQLLDRYTASVTTRGPATVFTLR